jgi:primosomal protein N' (replication factor Y)
MYVELIFPLPFRNSFTYSIPEELEEFTSIGVRAVAPFGKRTLTGYIINVSLTTDVKDKVKPVIDILDTIPVFDEHSLKFYQWLSDYYLCSLGEAIRLGIPYGTGVESKRKILVDKEITAQLHQSEKNKNTIKSKILNALIIKNEISVSALQNLVNKKNIHYALRALEKKGAITILDELQDPKVRIKTVKYVKLKKPAAEIYEFIPEIESRSPKQVSVLLYLISLKGKPALLSQVIKKTDAPHSSVTSLAEKDLVEIYEQEVERSYVEEYQEEIINFELTEKQKSVIDEVAKHFEPQSFQTYLLHGVTGSGKTQVYIELIKKVLSLNRTTLLLVPEISLTPQITSRLINNFGEVVSVIHSRMSHGERFDSWRRILKGKAKVVIGARSALFAPLKNIGVIIVDEEHDASYKQFDMSPKYNARDSAVVLGRIHNCPVLLGSATPSIESMNNAKTDKYKLITLPDRIDDAKLPKIQLVNVLVEKKKQRMENIFSKVLLDKIQDRLNKKEAIIILQNRRGFSTQIYCDDCGEIETCINCSVSMVYHINKNILQCHYCGFIKEVPKACSHCGSLAVKYFGTGTERVEDEVEYYFPGAKVKRIDSDAISRKASLSNILLEFQKGEIDILVGTQMVSKGLDFSRVTLVGVISAETNLWLPDFRADERTFQLLTQVSGRAGRSKTAGEVIIQTQNERRFALQKVLKNDYYGFYEKEIIDREKMGFPPFSRLCLIETKDLDIKKAEGAINDFYKELLPYKKWLKITPPSSAILARLKGFYRFHILIKSLKKTDPGGKILNRAVLEAFVNFNRKSRFKEVKLFYDVDPQNIA